MSPGRVLSAHFVIVLSALPCGVPHCLRGFTRICRLPGALTPAGATPLVTAGKTEVCLGGRPSLNFQFIKCLPTQAIFICSLSHGGFLGSCVSLELMTPFRALLSKDT